jgi:hypothetical protein
MTQVKTIVTRTEYLGETAKWADRWVAGLQRELERTGSDCHSRRRVLKG